MGDRGIIRKAETALLSVFLVLCMLINVQAQSDDQPDDSVSVRNMVYLELGGAAALYSLNYQLVYPHGFLLRFGASYLSDDSQVTLFPVGIGWHIPASDYVNFEISGGLTFINSSGSILFEKGRSSFGHTFLGLSGVSKSEESNDMYRIGVSPLIFDGLKMWGSFSFGFTF